MRGGKAPSRSKAKRNQRCRVTAAGELLCISGQFKFCGAGLALTPNMKDPKNDTGLFQFLATFGFGQDPKARALSFGKAWLEALFQSTNRS